MPRPPQAWTENEFKQDAEIARRLFVADRLAALRRERSAYEAGIATHSKAARELLARTSDLRRLDADSLKQREVLDIARYVVVPPISLDDLDTLTDSSFGRWVEQRTERGTRPPTASGESVHGHRDDGLPRDELRLSRREAAPIGVRVRHFEPGWR